MDRIATLKTGLEFVTSDVALFPLLQAVIVATGIIAAIQERRARARAGRGGVSLSVGRGDQSVSIFYGAYAAATGVLIALILRVSLTHKVLWVVVDTFVTAFVCIVNPWSRNQLLGYASKIRDLEKR